MGCDIHLYVETRVKGKWRAADKWQTDKDDDSRPKRLHVPYEQSFYHGRNYNLFAILADVRNGRGFAGVKTGEGFVPIAEPRGLPNDTCAEVKADSDSWDSDGHSHSHLTVAEIMAYDWTQVSTLQGNVSGIEFAEWIRYRRGVGKGPDSYCGDCFGRDIVNLAIEDMEIAVKKAQAAAKKLGEEIKPADYDQFMFSKIGNLHTVVSWTEPYYEAGAEFLGSTLPRLWRLGQPEDVRIVFWFDN